VEERVPPGPRSFYVLPMQRSSARPGSARQPARWNAGFDDRAEDYDRLRADGHMARRRVDYFTEVVDRVPGTVLELGSGTGTLLRELAARRPDRTFVGVEPLANYVAFARDQARRAGQGNVRFEVGTAEDVDGVVDPGSVGLVISVDTLHHVQDLPRTVRAVGRVTGPGGRWRAMEPDRLHPYVWTYHVLVPGERTFPVRRFLTVAETAGWELAGRERLFLFPSGVRRVPGWAARVERRWEGVPVLSGAVVLDLVPADGGLSGATGR
jgi:SAM-dependent methyltransferase